MDDNLKETLLEHKAIIPQLVASVQHLVETQTETNKRLEEISKYLAKQAVFSNKLETIDKEIREAFTRRDADRIEKDKRIWKAIADLQLTQNSDNGCNSVKLVNKDLDALAVSVKALTESTQAIHDTVTKYPSSATIKWVLGFIIICTLSFGKYTFSHIDDLNTMTHEILTMLKRDIQDTKEIRDVIYGNKRR